MVIESLHGASDLVIDSLHGACDMVIDSLHAVDMVIDSLHANNLFVVLFQLITKLSLRENKIREIPIEIGKIKTTSCVTVNYI